MFIIFAAKKNVGKAFDSNSCILSVIAIGHRPIKAGSEKMSAVFRVRPMAKSKKLPSKAFDSFLSIKIEGKEKKSLRSSVKQKNKYK